MMLSPDAYLEEIKKASYKELINERKSLIKYINAYEKNEIAGDSTGSDWQICPTPDVRYQCYLEYLEVLCAYMKKKYNEEYIHGNKNLSYEE